MLYENFLTPILDMLIILKLVGIGIAVLLVLLKAVKLMSLHKAGLVKKYNALQSELQRCSGEVEVLNFEKNSLEKKKNSLQEKLSLEEEYSKELRSKIEKLSVENDLVKKKKAVRDQGLIHGLFTTSEEQGKMNAQLLAMQDELVAEKVVGVKEQESDTSIQPRGLDGTKGVKNDYSGQMDKKTTILSKIEKMVGSKQVDSFEKLDKEIVIIAEMLFMLYRSPEVNKKIRLRKAIMDLIRHNNSLAEKLKTYQRRIGNGNLKGIISSFNFQVAKLSSTVANLEKDVTKMQKVG